jgi:hypothetical protein
MGILTGLMLGVIAIELAALLLFSSRSTAVLDQIACLLARKPETLHPGYLELGNFCVWRYRQGQWQVIEDRCGPGFRPGDPPHRSGDYEGEIVRKPAQFEQMAGGPVHLLHAVGPLNSNYCVWRFQNGSWKIIEKHCSNEFVPGPEPHRKGDFEGEVVRKPAVPKR